VQVSRLHPEHTTFISFLKVNMNILSTLNVI
jgi:hypothetical protein